MHEITSKDKEDNKKDETQAKSFEQQQVGASLDFKNGIIFSYTVGCFIYVVGIQRHQYIHSDLSMTIFFLSADLEI